MFPKPFRYSEIDSVDATKSELYDRAYTYVVGAFKSAKDVVQLQDRERGKIIAKGKMVIHTMTDTWGNVNGDDYVDFTMTVDVKDGKARCQLSDFVHKNGFGAAYAEFGSLEPITTRVVGKRQKQRYYLVKSEIDAQASSLLSQFRLSLQKGDDW